MKRRPRCPVDSGPILPLAILTVLLAGCHDLTEYGDTGESGVVFIDLDEFEVRGTIPGIQGARSICSLGNDEIVVFCNSGTAWWLDSQALEVIESRVIGTPFSSGYTNAVVSAEGTIYLTGGYGGIIEIVPSSGIVLDEFPVGSVPGALCTSPDIGRLYVADGIDMGIREVWTGDNHVEKSLEMEFPVSAMAYMDPQRMMAYDAAFIAVSGLEAAPAYLVMAGEIFITEDLGLHGTFTDVAALTDTTIFAVVDPAMESGDGSISVVFYHPMPEGCDVNEIPLDGRPLRICTSGLPLAHRFYVASYLGGGASRVFEVEMMTLEVVDQVDIPGYPLDMVVHAGGEELVVLTQE